MLGIPFNIQWLTIVQRCAWAISLPQPVEGVLRVAAGQKSLLVGEPSFEVFRFPARGQVFQGVVAGGLTGISGQKSVGIQAQAHQLARLTSSL